MPHVAVVKMEAVEVANLVRSEKGKDVLVFKGFEFRFQNKILADRMERWFCSIRTCKCYIQWNEIGEIFGGSVMQSHDADSDDCLNRQIVHNCAKRRAKNY